MQGLEERLKKWQEEAQQLKIDNHALKLRIQALEAEVGCLMGEVVIEGFWGVEAC